MRCVECGGRGVTEGIETFCYDCGLVLEENPISEEPPRSLSTFPMTMTKQMITSRGNKLVLVSQTEKRENKYIIKTGLFCRQYNLPKIVEDDSKYIIKSMIKKRNLKGKNSIDYILGSIYVASNRNNYLIDINEMSKSNTRKRNRLNQVIKEIKREMKVTNVAKPGENIEKLIFSLNLGDYRKEIYEILDDYNGNFNPSSVGPGIIYYIVKKYNIDNISLSTISNESKKSVVTINKVKKYIGGEREQKSSATIKIERESGQMSLLDFGSCQMSLLDFEKFIKK